MSYLKLSKMISIKTPKKTYIILDTKLDDLINKLNKEKRKGNFLVKIFYIERYESENPMRDNATTYSEQLEAFININNITEII